METTEQIKQEGLKAVATTTPAPVLTTPEPEEPTSAETKSVATFKVSGHFTDNKLKHGFDRIQKGESEQLCLLDALLPDTRTMDIDAFKPYKDELVVQGIRLSTTQNKTIEAIIRILQRKSGKDGMGNLPAEVVKYGREKRKAPRLGVSIYEIAVETYGENYSGREWEILVETLEELNTKKFLISYQRKNKDETAFIVETYKPLIEVFGLYPNVSKEEQVSKAYRKKANGNQIIIELSPIFVDQIDTKFIEYPIDIDSRTMIAAEALNGRYPEAILRLRDYLLRWLSNNKGKNSTTEIDEERLYAQLGMEKYMREKRWKQIKKNTEKALKAVKNLGIITKYERIIGARGQWKYVFQLNSEWK
jgi:hypothetical protein